MKEGALEVCYPSRGGFWGGYVGKYDNVYHIHDIIVVSRGPI